MFELFIGDVDQSLADQATAHSKAAVLITSANVNDFLDAPIGTAYSSLGDIVDPNLFFRLCSKADKIYYRPPIKWSDHSAGNDSKRLTEALLAGLSQYISVDGIEKISDQKIYFNYDFLRDKRKTHLPQGWFVGCSITYGVGVDQDQTFRHIIAKKIPLEFTNLSRPGSSIIWQSDQICRSDVRPQDIVFWGLTNQNRLPVFNYELHASQKTVYRWQTMESTNSDTTRQQEPPVIHLNTGIFRKEPQLITKFPIDLIDNDTLTYHNILAVRRAYNFCQKVGAKLVILGLMHDNDSVYLHYDVPVFRQMIFWPKKYPDLGTDNEHPGSQSHQMFAREFLELYSKLYAADLVANS